MGKRAELELAAIRLYAEGVDIPAIATELSVSENSLRKWKAWAGTEWDDARKAARKDQLTALEDVGARLRRSREITARLVGDAQGQGAMGLVLNQTLQTMLYDLLGQMQTSGIVDIETMAATIAQVKDLTLVLQRTEAAANLNLKREAEIRKRITEEAADKVSEVAKQEGVSAETIQRIRRDVLMMAG